ncbi:hypothetical protein TNCV_3644821 [Trichonephila clavipes]|nr:hypothetical protein TNCV_3644821 [Trichonephila clavipes]
MSQIVLSPAWCSKLRITTVVTALCHDESRGPLSGLCRSSGISNNNNKLVVVASVSRPEGLGSMPVATKYPPSTHGFHVEILEVEIGSVAIYRTFGEFRRAKSYCHLYGAQGQRQAYL